MTGFISRVINYVESRVPPKSKIDEWDIHKALINDVLRCTMQPAGKQNFKRAMDTILRWCSKGTGKNGEGRMTTEPTFPKDGEFEKNVRLIKTLWSDFKSSILEPSLTQRSSEAEINIAIDAYMPYFDDAAKRSEVSKSIAEVYRNSKKPAKFVKTNNRYDQKISYHYNKAARFLACLLVRKCRRGGVPTTVTMSEYAKAVFMEGEDVYHVLVTRHKNQASGPLDVFIPSRDKKLFDEFYALRKRMASLKGTDFTKCDLLIPGLDGKMLKHL
ncbi:hypothetical protein ONE63_005105 [Megalurothrips usitatus]|uniref:Uncharacterized protein n=1 Tax=Megalurothrips usitatus TaxID=439358 RepID=A0AAV7Y1P5_9NEOP|nr:hypothetical protein ONE63_005105 [Megalurothrips usitatus]